MGVLIGSIKLSGNRRPNHEEDLGKHKEERRHSVDVLKASIKLFDDSQLNFEAQ